jgi:site-specific recombinase XerD
MAAPRGKASSSRYRTRTYCRYVMRCCGRLKDCPPWHPNQLRHNAATRFQRLYGLEVTRLLLGHTKVETTQIYTERDRKKALKVMRRIG